MSAGTQGPRGAPPPAETGLFIPRGATGWQGGGWVGGGGWAVCTNRCGCGAVAAASQRQQRWLPPHRVAAAARAAAEAGAAATDDASPAVSPAASPRAASPATSPRATSPVASPRTAARRRASGAGVYDPRWFGGSLPGYKAPPSLHHTAGCTYQKLECRHYPHLPACEACLARCPLCRGIPGELRTVYRAADCAACGWACRHRFARDLSDARGAAGGPFPPIEGGERAFPPAELFRVPPPARDAAAEKLRRLLAKRVYWSLGRDRRKIERREPPQPGTWRILRFRPGEPNAGKAYRAEHKYSSGEKRGSRMSIAGQSRRGSPAGALGAVLPAFATAMSPRAGAGARAQLIVASPAHRPRSPTTARSPTAQAASAGAAARPPLPTARRQPTATIVESG